MKRSLIALAVLSSFAGVAQAASSVTLYGRVDIGYTDTTGDNTSVKQNKNDGGDLRLGLKGQEDLGNGMSATFHLEGRFDSDVGAKTVNRTFFDRESTVGLKGAFGHIRFGRSVSAMEQVLPLTDPGRRASSDDTYFSATRHSNALFYSYSNGGFTAGFDVATKGGYNDGLFSDKVSATSTSATLTNTPFSNEGASGTAVSYGLFLKYKGNGLEVGAAYQADRADKNKYVSATGVTVGSQKNEWGVAASYNLKPVTVAVSYAAGKTSALTNNKTRAIGASVTYAVTENDKINVIYRQLKNEGWTYKNSSGATAEYKKTRYGLGYIHSLSKRTSVYMDIASIKGYYSSDRTKRQTEYDIGLRHHF